MSWIDQDGLETDDVSKFGRKLDIIDILSETAETELVSYAHDMSMRTDADVVLRMTGVWIKALVPVWAETFREQIDKQKDIAAPLRGLIQAMGFLASISSDAASKDGSEEKLRNMICDSFSDAVKNIATRSLDKEEAAKLKKLFGVKEEEPKPSKWAVQSS